MANPEILTGTLVLTVKLEGMSQARSRWDGNGRDNQGLVITWSMGV